MIKDNFTKRTLLLLLLAVAAVALAAVLTVALVRDARDRAALEAVREQAALEWEKVNSANRTDDEDEVKRPRDMSGLELLAAGRWYDTVVYYFGDDTLYGRGAAEELGVDANSYRTMLKEGLSEELSLLPSQILRGRVYAERDGTYTPSLATLSRDLAYYRSLDFRLLFLTPTARTAWAGVGGDGEDYTGDFIRDLETLLRKIRTEMKHCDIVLTVPHDADNETATAMLALAAHYGLIAVDTRAPMSAGEGLIHTEGENLGYPTEAGHRVYAEAILAAVRAAIAEGYTVTEIPCPEERLYEERN